MSVFKILLIDDHALFIQGLKFLLADLRSDIEFLEASNCADALQFANDVPIDLILLDYHLDNGASEQQALKNIRTAYPESTTVVLSSEDDPEIVQIAVEFGAAGFIPKSSTPEIMIAALQLTLAGGIYIPPQLLRKAKPVVTDQTLQSGQKPDGLVEQLSDRQMQVLMRAIQGKPNKIIARELNIAEGTVKAHLSVAYRILGVKNRTEAVFLASQLGLKS